MDIYKPDDFKVDIKLPGKLARRLGGDDDIV